MQHQQYESIMDTQLSNISISNIKSLECKPEPLCEMSPTPILSSSSSVRNRNRNKIENNVSNENTTHYTMELFQGTTTSSSLQKLLDAPNTCSKLLHFAGISNRQNPLNQALASSEYIKNITSPVIIQADIQSHLETVAQTDNRTDYNKTCVNNITTIDECIASNKINTISSPNRSSRAVAIRLLTTLSDGNDGNRNVNDYEVTGMANAPASSTILSTPFSIIKTQLQSNEQAMIEQSSNFDRPRGLAIIKGEGIQGKNRTVNTSNETCDSKNESSFLKVVKNCESIDIGSKCSTTSGKIGNYVISNQNNVASTENKTINASCFGDVSNDIFCVKNTDIVSMHDGTAILSGLPSQNSSGVNHHISCIYRSPKSQQIPLLMEMPAVMAEQNYRINEYRLHNSGFNAMDIISSSISENIPHDSCKSTEGIITGDFTSTFNQVQNTNKNDAGIADCKIIRNSIKSPLRTITSDCRNTENVVISQLSNHSIIKMENKLVITSKPLDSMRSSPSDKISLTSFTQKLSQETNLKNASSWSSLASGSPQNTPILSKSKPAKDAFQQFCNKAKQKLDRQKLLEQQELKRTQKEAAEKELKRQNDHKQKQQQHVDNGRKAVHDSTVSNRVDEIKASPIVDNSIGTSTVKQDGFVSKRAELRWIEQDRRRREALAGQIDMNMQSDLMAAFEETLDES